MFERRDTFIILKGNKSIHMFILLRQKGDIADTYNVFTNLSLK